MDINLSAGMDALTTEERARYVAELLQVLMEINEMNGGGVDNAEKMKVHVKNFESALFAKCSTKKEYINSMKEKITAMCNTRDARKKASMAAAAAKQQQQQQQIPSSSSSTNNNNNNSNFVPNSSNANSRTFLNQQAQVRQQAAQQLKQQQLNTNINSGQQGLQQKPRPQLTAQQQLLINQMKVAPIPRELLQKIPNVPPGINTWQQITELAQQKRFTQQEMLIAKEVYKVHQQLLYKSKMQQQQAQQAQQLKQQNMQSQLQNQNQSPQQQQINNMNQQMQPNAIHQQQSQSQQQQPQRNANRPGEIPNVLGQIHQIFTQEEQKSILAEAIEACKHFQKTQYGGNMTDAAKHNFIKKYINQKALKKIQAIKMSQAVANAGNGNGSASGNVAGMTNNATTSNNTNLNNPNNNNTNINTNNFPNQQLQGNSNIQRSISNNTGGNFSHIQTSQNVSMPQMSNNNSNNNNNLKHVQNNQMMNQQVGNPQIGQTPIRNHPNNNQMQNSQKSPANNGQQNNSGLQMFQPTQQDLEMVRKISAAAARIPLRLTDLTNMISQQEKEEIKRKLQMNQQLFAQVGNYAPQVYVFTKSEPFLKEVLQLRIFVKEILEKCSRGIYVVKLDTVDKLVMKYQKYWESMKLQILRRQQLIEQQKRQQQQQQQQQQMSQRNINNSQQGNMPNNSMITNNSNISNNNNGNMTRLSPQGQTPSIPQQQQQWNTNQQVTVPAGATNGNMFSPQNLDNSSKNDSIANTPKLPQTNLNDLTKNRQPLNNNNSNNNSNALAGVPEMSKNSTASHDISPKKENATPHSRNKSTSKKPSPAMTSGFSSNNISTLSSKSATPKNTGISHNSNNRAQSTSQQSFASSPNQNAIQNNTAQLQMQFKKEVETLESLNIKKGEMISRYKHRQDLFRSSPIDIFLGTLADTLGIKDEDIEPPMMKFSKHTIDTVNGTGKKKLTKVQQRVRDRDVVDIHINDDHRLIMKSKAVKEGRLYDIKLKAIAGVFKSVMKVGENDIVQSMVSENTIMNPSLTNPENDKKRKISDIDSETTSSTNQDSINSGDFISPSTGSLMGESKRIKLDSPEDIFSENFNEASGKEDIGEYEKRLGVSKKDKINNFWNWDFWSKLQG
ncbi:hypothetical protein RI543_003618 [Arxiozyma heterogenica]|uniref:Mediator of RNA polymerase II transcription subunit 15 n=1 Tax=Arxiozyma heterogenica TaxID=278026 RepID=A0AAN7WLQ6_9SACH|nr:hypothetical protein RI543_003618 [Kazachstania heterogenica]